ncbi:hypothetical protein OQH61_02365 [Helicobacter sp. MIT 21-1697]|uniref:hypothetical protein n=1 Tax=Helicobacter sp. MIT 21-1697 TaxID=2993733 RepID=UPI00224AEB5C|nr:hypothetical protein [Helicobacter sp. MIT 21-1697]MCX2716574.1 hypothetical protein [Helicobacter sp. MIT 21-1697]
MIQFKYILFMFLLILPFSPLLCSNHTNAVFYIEKLSVGSNSNLSMNNLHTLALQGGLILEDSATLEVILQKGQKIPTSEFAPSSKVHFSRNANFYLGNGSTLHISNTDFVVINSQGTIHNNAQMIIDAGTIRFQNTLHNSGTIELIGDVYNIGQSAHLSSLGISHFVNYGNIKVNGNFYNGGTPRADLVQGSLWQNDAPSQGGGHLINYGGRIHITGSLINAQGIELGKTQNSSVQVYGGIIKVDGDITNEANNTLILGWHNGAMGQLDGRITNRGIAKVHIRGATLNVDHKIAGYWGTGRLDKDRDVLLNGSKSEFLDTRISHYLDKTIIALTKNNQAIDAFRDSLPIQSKNILTALEESLYNPHTTAQESIYAYGNRDYLSHLSDNINDSIESMLVYASPLHIWSMLQHNIASFQASQAMPPPRKVNIAPFVSYGSRSWLKSPLYGANLNAQIPYGAHYLNVFTTYAAANATHSFGDSQTHFNTRSLLVGINDKISLKQIEILLLAYFGTTFNKSKRYLLMNNSSFQARYSYYELGLWAHLGVPHIVNEKLHIKSFMGFDYALGMQSSLRESSISNATSAKLSAPMWFSHLPQLVFGTQGQYNIKKQHSLFGGVQIQYVLTNPSFYAYFGSSHLSFSPKNSLGFTFHLGGSMPLTQEIFLGAFVFHSRSHIAFQTYSGTLNLSYYF